MDEPDPLKARFAPRGGMLSTAVIALLAWLLAIAGYWVGREPPMRYSRQDKNHFEPAVAPAGSRVSLCFAHIEWTRRCRAVIHERMKCTDPRPTGVLATKDPAVLQHQVDIGVRQVTLPPGATILENKCRDFVVPSAEACAPGPAAYTATFEAFCTPPDEWWPYRANVEPIPFTIAK